MMNTRTILETLARQGYAASILHYADGTVAVRAVHSSGHLVRVTEVDELHAAVAVWNRLGCEPRLTVAMNGEGVPTAKPVKAARNREGRWTQRFEWISSPFRMLLRTW